MCSSCPPFLWGYKLTVNYLGLVQNKLVLAIWKSVGGTNKTFFSSGVSFRALQLCLMGLRCYWGPLNQTPDHNEEMLLLFQETSTLRLTLITVTRSSLKYIYIFLAFPAWYDDWVQAHVTGKQSGFESWYDFKVYFLYYYWTGRFEECFKWAFLCFTTRCALG